MNAVWYGIAHVFESMFKLVKAIGPYTNWFFGISITVGVIYWLWYDASVRKGKSNYMSFKGK